MRCATPMLMSATPATLLRRCQSAAITAEPCRQRDTRSEAADERHASRAAMTAARRKQLEAPCRRADAADTPR